MTVSPRSATGLKVETTSMPCVLVANALVKNRNRRRSRAASTPCTSNASISAFSRVKSLVMPMRSETSMRK